MENINNPLLTFILENNLKKVEYFLSKFKNQLNSPIHLEKTALDIAIQHKNIEIIRYLLQSGAEIKEKEFIDTPIDNSFLLAVKTESIVIIKEIALSLKEELSKFINAPGAKFITPLMHI